LQGVGGTRGHLSGVVTVFTVTNLADATGGCFCLLIAWGTAGILNSFKWAKGGFYKGEDNHIKSREQVLRVSPQKMDFISDSDDEGEG